MPGSAQRPEGDLLDEKRRGSRPAPMPMTKATDHGQMPDAQGKVSHERPHHVDLAVGEGDQVHGAEDDDEPDGDEGVDTSLGQAVDQLLENQQSLAHPFHRCPLHRGSGIDSSIVAKSGIRFTGASFLRNLVTDRGCQAGMWN